ncbi:MAG TPA: DUF1579 family protein [Fimbriimonadaceae bacterium]|jgi:hypothetical protein
MKTLTSALLCICASLALGQGHNESQPSPKLDAISFLEGNWSGKQNFQMDGGRTMAADITLSVTKEVGGRYMQEKSLTTLPGGRTGSAVHMLAYDPKLGQYKVWWFNDTSVDPQMLTGAISGDKLVMETAAKPDYKGPIMKATYDREADDHFTYTLQMKTGSTWRTLFITDYHKS